MRLSWRRVSPAHMSIDICTTTDTAEQLYLYRDLTAAADLAESLLRDRERAQAVAQRGRDYVLTTFSTGAMRKGLALAYAAAVQSVASGFA